MKIGSWIIPLTVLLLALRYEHNVMCLHSARITYSRDSLNNIGSVVGARPRIADSLLRTLQSFNTSRIRPRGSRGGKNNSEVYLGP